MVVDASVVGELNTLTRIHILQPALFYLKRGIDRKISAAEEKVPKQTQTHTKDKKDESFIAALVPQDRHVEKQI